MEIAGFDIQKKVFIIAELSANHGNDLNIAKETIRAMKRSGADAVKLQTYTADSITLDVRTDEFKISHGTAWDNKYFYDLYKEASLPMEWHEELFNLAKDLDMICFSSPFDLNAVDFLEELEVPAYKIASFEITDIPLIEYVASKKKPIIISTGIANEEDIELAIKSCKAVGNDQIVLLQCTSSYPAPIEKANLRMIESFKSKFDVISGLSDHTLGTIVPIVAVSLGARVIEKHFILDKEIGGADAGFSLDESEFKQMVDSVRLAEKSLGVVDYELSESKMKSRNFARSLYISEDVEQGDVVTKFNVRSVRPGHGLHPVYLKEIQGKKFGRAFKKGTPMKLEYLQ